MDPNQIYPDYLSDPNINVSPAHPGASELIALDDPAIALHDHSYWYLGYLIPDEATGLAFVEHFREQARAGAVLTETLNLGGETVYPLREGVERFLITDIDQPQPAARAASAIPVMIERPGLQVGGSNVLFLDGHVEFLEYPGPFPMTEGFIRALESLDELK